MKTILSRLQVYASATILVALIGGVFIGGSFAQNTNPPGNTNAASTKAANTKTQQTTSSANHPLWKFPNAILTPHMIGHMEATSRNLLLPMLA